MINKSTRILFLFPTVLLSAFVCVVLAFAAYVTFNHRREMSFASTQGVVDSISRTIPTGLHSGGPSLNIRYHYKVADHQYEGYRFCFVEDSGEAWQLDMMRRFSTGTHPTVYYNPTNPADAVLIRGTQGSELHMALFLMPFVVLVLTFWFAIVASSPKSERFLGLRIYEKGTTTQIRPWPWYAIGAAAAGLGLSALAFFVIVIGATGGNPSLAAAEAAWGGVLGITVVAGVAVGAYVKSGVSLRMPKQRRVIRGYSEQPGALPVGIGFVLLGLCAGVPTWWNAWNAFHQSHPSEAPWVSLMIPCMLTLFFFTGIVCLVDAFRPRAGAQTGEVARRQTSRSQKDYRVVEKADEIKFILPRCPIPLHHIAGGYLFAAPFILMGTYLAIAMYRPEWLGTRNPPTGSSIDKLVVTLVPVLLLFIGSYVGLAVTMAWLGRIEVRLSNAGLESRRVFGPIRFRSRRDWKSVRQLAVKTPSGSPPDKAKSPTDSSDLDREPMALYAYSSGQEPLILATLLPRSMLLLLAKDVIRYAPRFSGRRGAVASGTTALATEERRAVSPPLAFVPSAKYSRLIASEIPRGGVRITMRRNWPVAIACGIVLALILVAFLTEGSDHAAWLHSIISLPPKHDAFACAAFVMMSVPFILFLIRGLTARVFDVDATALSRTIQGPFGRRSERWKRDEIAGIAVQTETRSRGKGGSYTVHSLILRRQAGPPVNLVSNLKGAELEWMGNLLSAALRIQEISNVQTKCI